MPDDFEMCIVTWLLQYICLSFHNDKEFITGMSLKLKKKVCQSVESLWKYNAKKAISNE